MELSPHPLLSDSRSDRQAVAVVEVQRNLGVLRGTELLGQPNDVHADTDLVRHHHDLAGHGRHTTGHRTRVRRGVVGGHRAAIADRGSREHRAHVALDTGTA